MPRTTTDWNWNRSLARRGGAQALRKSARTSGGQRESRVSMLCDALGYPSLPSLAAFEQVCCDPEASTEEPGAAPTHDPHDDLPSAMPLLPSPLRSNRSLLRPSGATAPRPHLT